MNAQVLERARIGGQHICPWWVAYFFDNPLRRLRHPPKHILGPYVTEGMTVLDYGCGFGHYSLGMARLTGPSGRVIAADIQQKMLDKTMARAHKAGLDPIIKPLLCNDGGLDDSLELDFVLASNVLHETPDPGALLRQFAGLLNPGGRLFILEPAGRVITETFEAEIAAAAEAGFQEIDRPAVLRERTSVLAKRD